MFPEWFLLSPEAYRKLVERIAALRPDLVVAWGSGNPRRQLDLIRELGIPLFVSEPDQ